MGCGMMCVSDTVSEPEGNEEHFEIVVVGIHAEGTIRAKQEWVVNDERVFS